MAQILSYNPYNGVGLEEGVHLVWDKPRLGNDGGYYPPHLECGHEYIVTAYDLSKRLRPNQLLRHASLHLDAEKGLRLVSSSAGSELQIFVAINTQLPLNFRWRVNLDALRPWVGFNPTAEVTVVRHDRSTGSAFVVFKEGGILDLFLPDGQVRRLQCENGSVSCVELSFPDMAHLRVQQFESQLETSHESVVQGVLWSAVRFLNFAIGNVKVRDVFRAFLFEQNDLLTLPMRRETRRLLLSVNDSFASYFLEGDTGPGVVPIHKPAAKSTALVKKAQLARKQARSAAAIAKGAGGGGKQKKI
ncbi:hypothetical protein K2Q16_03415 [Patescibacteria group bacterium]|nr:hypothetical protein [Patescibacteria group bacterium]